MQRNSQPNNTPTQSPGRSIAEPGVRFFLIREDLAFEVMKFLSRQSFAKVERLINGMRSSPVIPGDAIKVADDSVQQTGPAPSLPPTTKPTDPKTNGKAEGDAAV